MAKGNGMKIFLYIFLVVLLLMFLFLHAFKVIALETGTFTKYLIGLLVVVLLLPAVPKIKIFDVIDIKRDTKLFAKKK